MRVSENASSKSQPTPPIARQALSEFIQAKNNSSSFAEKNLGPSKLIVSGTVMDSSTVTTRRFDSNRLVIARPNVVPLAQLDPYQLALTRRR